jgi:hypothetical protein
MECCPAAPVRGVVLGGRSRPFALSPIVRLAQVWRCSSGSARRYRESGRDFAVNLSPSILGKRDSAKGYKQLHARPEADIRQEATVLEPFAACQHLFVGLLAVGGSQNA